MSTTGQSQNKTNKTKTIRQGRRLDDINNHRTKEASIITVSPRKQCVVVVSTNPTPICSTYPLPDQASHRKDPIRSHSYDLVKRFITQPVRICPGWRQLRQPERNKRVERLRLFFVFLGLIYSSMITIAGNY